MQLFLMALAGGLGTLARYGVSLACQRLSLLALAGFPLGTLVVNVLGSFLIGLVATGALKGLSDANARLVLGTGFLGGFTTFSAFELETHKLVSEREWVQVALYVGGNLVLGFLGVVAGILVANKYFAVAA